ncbi:MAG: type II toxin-antitoxin system RelE/ParE family toxin [Planctomycetes bacterium]|nr:type II toxin-antitoxin system RelE/ParE family toxin [Planctomycetota bacterium]
MNPPAVAKRPQVLIDLLEQAEFISRHRYPAGVRFLEAAEEAFQVLAAMPRMGSVRRVRNPRLQGLRMWPIPGFEKHLIFYLPSEDGVEIVRVLHGARNVEFILERE